MSGVKISALPAASAANDTDQLEVNQGGTSRRVTVGQIAVELASALTPAVSIERYGASTSASGAVNSAAITAALAANRAVHIPDGTYRVADQYAGAASRRICIRVPANRTVLGPGKLLFTTPVGSSTIVGILSVIGSNVRVQGVTFDDDHDSSDGSTCRAQGVVCGDGEDSAVVADIENVVIDDCTFLNNFHPVVVRAAASTPLVFSDFRLTGCRGRANPQATYSAGFTVRANSPTLAPGVRPVRNVVCAFNTFRGATNGGGVQLFGVSGGTLLCNTAEDCLFSAVQIENGCDNIVILGNRTMRSGRAIWSDDSQYVAIVGNIANVTATTPPDTGSPVQHGIYFTREGFSGETSYESTGLVAASNVVVGGDVASGTFGGAPAGSFGSISVTGNDVRHNDGTATANALSLSAGGTKNVIGNTLKGGTTATIDFSSTANEPTTLVGNITSKVAAEASAGLAVTGSPEMVAGFNDFTNGVGGTTGIQARFGNRDAGVTQPMSQSAHLLNFGTNTPEAALSGTSGDLFQRTDAAASSMAGLYVKVGTGTTGWRPAQVVTSGTTASRPVISATGSLGFAYFDTTLGKPVWWNGTVWKDATGTTV
jgi:hypothetical protein